MTIRKLALPGTAALSIAAPLSVASAEEGIATICAPRGKATASGDHARATSLTTAL